MSGGLGGDLRSDRLLMRAITEGWGISPDRLPAVIDRLLDVATNSDSEREAVSAAKALISATKLKLDEAKLDLDRQRLDVDKATSKIVVEYYDRPIDPDGEVPETASEPNQGPN